MRTHWLHTLFSSTTALSYLGLTCALAAGAHPHSSAVTGSPPSPLVATLRFPRARVLQMVPDDATGRLFVLTQVAGRRGQQPVTEGVFDPRTGALLHTVTLAPDYALDSYQIDPRTGRIVFANTTQDNGPNVAHVVDGTTGRPLLTFSTGKSPFDIAIDPQRNYLLVVSVLVMRAFDLRTGRPIQRAFVPLGSGGGNYFFLVNPRDGLVYVNTENDDGVLLLDELTGAVRGRVFLGRAYDTAAMVTATFDQRADALLLTVPKNSPQGYYDPQGTLRYDVYAVDGRTGRHVRDIYGFGAISGKPSINTYSVVGQGPAGPVFTIVNDTMFDPWADCCQTPHTIKVDAADLATGGAFGGKAIEPYLDNAETDLQLDERARRAFLVITSDEGSPGSRASALYVFDFQGSLLHHPLSLGTGAVTLGVLPRAGRVLILHHSDNTIGILDVARL